MKRRFFERKGGYYKPAFFNIVEKFTQKKKNFSKCKFDYYNQMIKPKSDNLKSLSKILE